MTLQPRGTGTITQKQAMYLLRTIWPNAPEAEVIKASIICKQYNLNPLMKQVFLIPFGNTWVTVLGIDASRAIAQRNHKYGFIDSPRVMTKDEQLSILGRDEESFIYAICRIKDSDGNEFPGFGTWDKAFKPHGADKGNSGINMAFIRAERNALGRMAPGELPEVDVATEGYVSEGEYSIAAEEGKAEFIQAGEEDIQDYWLEGFNIDMLWLKESLHRLDWRGAGLYLYNTYNVRGDTVSEMVTQLTKNQAREFVEEIDNRLKAL